ncbi:MAG: hypothetical protein WBA77_18970 [Microcoleaceae cyanobacterium]
METWEFLLQREEDNTWLPLESSDVEILEGRYRIVARSGLASTEVEIRITHHAYEETPPIRRVQTRKTKTTPEGLMVVIPYTRLKPGIWDLACSPSGQSDGLGLSWQQSIKLRVLPQEAELGESSTPNLPAETESTPPDSDDTTETVTTEAELSAETETITTESVSPQNEAELSPETATSDVESSTNEYDWVKWDAFAETTSVQPPPPPETETSQTINTTELPLLQLTLNQTAYVAKLGEGFLVSGQVQQLEETEATITSLTEPYLQVSLRDPQTGDILTETQQPVPATELPIVFSAIIYLPFECKTRLILAEISLYDQTVAVARQTFTVTTQVEHLLQAIEEDFSEIDELESMVEDLPNNSAFYLSLPLEPESEQLSLPESQALPPLISQPTSAKLELPGFGNFISENNPTEATPEETLTAATETTKTPETGEVTQIQPIEEIKPLSPVEQEFKHLNIQDRFWTRLNSLATDQDLSQWMRNTTPKPLPETPLLPGVTQPTPAQDSRDSQSATLDAFASSISEDLESQEIVIDDEPIDESPALYPRRPTTPRLQLVPARDEQQLSLPEAFPNDQPLPAPTLEIMTDELVAGRSVPVRVRLPQDLPRVYTKIWVYDRQARNIIDGPRWLTEFAPNGLDEIETMVNLDIAYGSLEVQIEAIAVEMQTQRESQKATLERTVMPPSEPSLPLEED